MRKVGRRAAVGATSLALVLAAVGTSLAAVRASRYEGGVAGSGVALAAPDAVGIGPDRTLPPTADLPPAGEGNPLLPPPPADGTVAGGAPAPAGPATAAPTAPGQAPATSGSTATGRQAGPAVVASGRRVTVTTLGPATGPTPTTSPTRPLPPPGTCPSDTGTGALPLPTGELRAVDFTLPWPGEGPLVLVPQISAPRSPNASVRITAPSGGIVAGDGSSLTVPTAVPVVYTLVAGQARAQGTIRFTPVGVTVSLDPQACRDRSFTLYDVKRATLNGSPLRVVGYVAPTGAVTIDGNGGTAHFRATTPGNHKVMLLTANDGGATGPLVTATVTIP